MPPSLQMKGEIGAPERVDSAQTHFTTLSEEKVEIGAPERVDSAQTHFSILSEVSQCLYVEGTFRVASLATDERRV